MTPLFRFIADEIRMTGPIGLDRYLALCLGHPVHGYYRTRDPLGRAGDFVTAPEISQMFGELIGVWIAAVREAMGGPLRLDLVELGPGRGTLMADALRVLRKLVPDATFRVHLVETSPVLRKRQAETLRTVPVEWHEDIVTLPDGPAIVIANEFFDALPVRQFEKGQGGWRERLVGLSLDGSRLAVGLCPEPDPRIRHDAPIGAVLTLPGPALDLVRALAGRFARDGGALLAIDYGHDEPGFGDTLQALAGHGFVDPLAAPGEADLSTHVDFSALARAARKAGAGCHGPIDQADFLVALGLRERAMRLAAQASQSQVGAIEAAFARLTNRDRGGMGRLFKVLAIADPRLGALPGLPASADASPRR